jgi:type II secretory pathway pseudopilin PulG
MSNVLIGIIGVILFIGLALAGALFLGPRFQESTNNSKASAAIQAVAQIQQAAEMFRVDQGASDLEVWSLGVTGLQTRGFLKSVPTISGGGTIAFRNTSVNGADVVVAGSNLSSAAGNNSQKICEAINRQTSGSATIPGEAASTSGCYSPNAGQYQVYSRIG